MHFSLFPALFDKPQHIFFAEQEENETIELFLRQHWFVNVPWVLGAIFGFFLPVLFILLDSILQLNFLIKMPIQFIIGALIIWYLLVVAYVIESFLFWYYNIYIITNLHLIDIGFSSLLLREIVEVQYNDVQSASSKIMGIFGSLFNFGDVIIETAAKNHNISFAKVPRPDFVADRISDIQEANERSFEK